MARRGGHRVRGGVTADSPDRPPRTRVFAKEAIDNQFPNGVPMEEPTLLVLGSIFEGLPETLVRSKVAGSGRATREWGQHQSARALSRVARGVNRVSLRSPKSLKIESWPLGEKSTECAREHRQRDASATPVLYRNKVENA